MTTTYEEPEKHPTDYVKLFSILAATLIGLAGLLVGYPEAATGAIGVIGVVAGRQLQK